MARTSPGWPAAGNNGVGIAGAAFACKLIDEKLSDTEDIEDSLIAQSITDATDHGADVISMSFGGPGRSGVINQALDYAYSHDVVLVAAASNETRPTRERPPRTCSRTAPARRSAPERGWWSPRRAQQPPRLVPPRPWHRHLAGRLRLGFRGLRGSARTAGSSPPSPATTTSIEQGPGCGHCRASFQGSSDFAYLEGTSMATPQVAGAAALIRSKRPQIKNTRVLRILKRTADGPNFRDTLGWGVLNAGRALKQATR